MLNHVHHRGHKVLTLQSPASFELLPVPEVKGAHFKQKEKIVPSAYTSCRDASKAHNMDTR
ncbi:hypothetical protein EYF80_004707 [Liparis tanakae]|uniref:Uncharacterized protein n=1 Tax=Liparis tanakae TaxID=230148 RepID=A0A4Z2J678_9TELE|nr:hypothetical protein EYF80_004707 [Liparis tanakae]